MTIWLYLRTKPGLIRRLVAVLDRHWFAPASLRDLALVRILAFGTQTLFFMHWQSLDQHLAQVRDPASLYRPVVVLKLLLLPFGAWGHPHPAPTLLFIFWLAALVAGVLATIGLFARVSMVGAALTHTLLITHWYSYGEYHHPEALITVLLNILALAPSAKVWSVDAMRRSRRFSSQKSNGAKLTAEMSPFARWPMRLMQWLLALMYFSATASKLYHGGLKWMNGYTLSYHFLSEGLAWEHRIPMFMASLPPWMHIIPSVLTILFESTFFVAIVVPRTAWLYVLWGTIFHLLIWLTQGPPFFPTIVLYSVFAESIRLYFPIRFGRNNLQLRPKAIVTSG
jgi:uncharacterized membrane protein YphA (DoxX/SURF4 family)